MFRRKNFALLILFQNIQELFTQNVPNNRKCSVEKVLHFWNCSRTFKNFLPKIFQINGNIPKHCKVFPRNVQSKSFWKMFMKHSKIVSKTKLLERTWIIQYSSIFSISKIVSKTKLLESTWSILYVLTWRKLLLGKVQQVS